MYGLHRLSLLRVKRAGGQKQRLWRKIGVRFLSADLQSASWADRGHFLYVAVTHVLAMFCYLCLGHGPEPRPTKLDHRRAESRHRYLCGPALCVVSGLETGRDVGLAKSGFHPTATPTERHGFYPA